MIMTTASLFAVSKTLDLEGTVARSKFQDA